jgi:uncharacterized protein YcbK (DUF882 family)
MIKTFFKLFYNNILSICYDTQKNTQDDIIIDFNNYNDYKIQKKTDFYNSDFLEHNLIKTDYKYKNFFQEECENIEENKLSDIEHENSYDDCKSKEDFSDYDRISDLD